MRAVRLTVLSIASVAALASWWLPSGAIQAAQPAVFIDPPSKEASVGETTRVAVSIEDVTDATGFAFIVNVNPNVIELRQLALGSFAPDCNVQVNQVDSGAGQADFACITVPLEGSSGSGVVAEVEFTCLREGASNFALAGMEVTDSSAQLIGVDVESGRVTCRSDAGAAAAGPDEDSQAVPEGSGSGPDSPPSGSEEGNAGPSSGAADSEPDSQGPGPTGGAIAPSARTTPVVPKVSDAASEEAEVAPETSVAQAETSASQGESGGGAPFRSIGIGLGVGAAVAVLAAGVLIRYVRRPSAAAGGQEEE